MKKNFDDFSAEEQENPDLITQFQAMYHTSAKNSEVLDRIRQRLLTYTQQHPLPENEISASRTQHDAVKEGKMHNTFIATKKEQPSWHHNLSMVAAVVIVTLLVGSLVATFTLLHHASVRTGGAAQYIAPLHPPVPWDQLDLVNATSAWLPTLVHMPGEGDVVGPLLHTIDAGKTWQDVTPPQQGFDASSQLYPFDANVAWLLTSPVSTIQSGAPVLYRTLNGGRSWQAFSLPHVSVHSLNFIDHNHGWILGNSIGSQKSSLFATDDGGQTWQQITGVQSSGITLTQETDVQFVNAQTGWLTTTSMSNGKQKLYVTHNGGQTWQSLSAPSAVQFQAGPGQQNGTSFYVKFFDAQNGYLVAQSHQNSKNLLRIYPTDDGGQTWQSAASVSLSDQADFLFMNDHQVVSMSSAVITQYTLSAGQWIVANRSQPPAGGHFLFSKFVSSTTGLVSVDYTKHTSANDFDTTGDNVQLLKTTNGGHSWAAVHLTFPITKVTPYTMAYLTNPGWTYFTAHEDYGSATFAPKDQSGSGNLNPAHLPNLTAHKWLVRFMCSGTNNAVLSLNGKQFSTPNCNLHPVSTVVSFSTLQPVKTLKVTIQNNTSWLAVFQACTDEKTCKSDS